MPGRLYSKFRDRLSPLPDAKSRRSQDIKPINARTFRHGDVQHNYMGWMFESAL